MYISTLGMILAGVAAVLLIWLIATVNGLIRLRNRVQSGWSDIDVQLMRRHDLVPNLVEASKGYMQHERSILEDVTRARAQAASCGANVPERAVAEASLTGALSLFFIHAENYPALRAVESMKLLQEQLTSTENRIAFARQHYNDEVLKYNIARTSFPRNLFASALGFGPSEMFAAEAIDRAMVTVQMSESGLSSGDAR